MKTEIHKLQKADHKNFEDQLDKPADLNLAIMHGRCQKAYKILTSDLGGKIKFNIDVEYCDDCLLPEYTKGKVEPFSLFEHIKNFGHLGPGIYFYFYYLKFLIITLAIAGVMFSIPTMYAAKNYNSQLKNFCNSGAVITNTTTCHDFSIKKSEWHHSLNFDNLKYFTRYYPSDGKFTDGLVDYGFIVFLTIVVLLVIKYIFVIIVDALDLELDYLNITPSDYSLMISNVPKDIHSKEAIIDNVLTIPNKVGDETFDVNVKPIDINITYKIADYDKIKEQYLKIKKIIRQCELKKQVTYKPWFRKAVKLEDLKAQLDSLAIKLNEYQLDFENPDKKLNTGVVFAVFNSIKEYEAFLSFFPTSFLTYCIVLVQYIFAKFLCGFCCDEKKVKKLRRRLLLRVSPAPEPTDILWANLDISFIESVARTLICYFITVLMLGGSFVIILTLNVYQKRNKDNPKPSKVPINLIISIIINIINYFAVRTINKLTDYEKKSSLSRKYLSNSIKLQLVNFDLILANVY
jgi:hypothetical protein